ncbi:MAG: PGPGW domain-containing protein [Chlamydiae bacterium]|nr:PGPGW domain-containing protein [Chlamydiota bacterium]MBI3267261.1 PGPGW domain-containing protein [Chlamydiota bacterium]
MTKRIRRFLKLFCGWSLLAIGIVGLFLPFLQGILMIVSGLALLATEYPWAKGWLEGIKKKIKKK